MLGCRAPLRLDSQPAHPCRVRPRRCVLDGLKHHRTGTHRDRSLARQRQAKAGCLRGDAANATTTTDDVNNNNGDQHDHEHGVPSQRISSPDYVDLEIPQFVGVTSRQRSLVSTSSEGYPSWVSKLPPPPVSGSALPSLSTAMMFGSDGGAGPTEHPGGPARAWACLSQDVAGPHHVKVLISWLTP